MSTDELANSVSSHQRRKSPALQRILQLYWPAFARTHALPGFVHRAAYLLAHCRTAILGGHVTRCEQGHVLDVYYNSCRHRGCPACTATPRANWLAKWQAKMLDTPAHHVIFTVPNELVPLWRMNKRLFTAALFGAASQSLLTLLADPQYPGAKPPCGSRGLSSISPLVNAPRRYQPSWETKKYSDCWAVSASTSTGWYC